MRVMQRPWSVAVAAFGLLMACVAARAAEPIELRAGKLSMLFDVDNASLRYVKAGDHELVRGITAPIRDKNWGTVVPKVTNVHVDKQADHFKVTFDATCQSSGIDFRWQGTITGTAANEVEFTFDGAAHTTFQKNRIGICVLHPAAAAGKPWLLKHVDGSESKGAFPKFISPHQPAKNLRVISHETAKDLWSHVEMTGDTFEMEDQRNWTDASFKTYCTPLEIPYPVTIEKGTKVVHKVRISATGDVPDPPLAGRPVALTLGAAAAKLPSIGLQISSESAELSESQLQRLKALRLGHLYVELRPADRSFAEKLRQASRQHRELGVPLHVGVSLGKDADAELANLTRELKSIAPQVAMYLVNAPDWKQYEQARKVLAESDGKAKIGATKGSNFVDLNRDRPVSEKLDALGFAINPQIHAFDDSSIIETLPIHAQAVESARQFAGKMPLALGPITLRPLMTPGALGGVASTGGLPADVDLRQPSAFVAAWTLGSIKYLAEAGTENATYFETVGWKGVMDVDQPAQRPKEFLSQYGRTFAVYEVLRQIGGAKDYKVIRMDSSDPMAVVGLAIQQPSVLRLLLANFQTQPHPATINLPGLRGKAALVAADDLAIAKQIDALSGEMHWSVERPLVLPPRSIIRIDVPSK